MGVFYALWELSFLQILRMDSLWENIDVVLFFGDYMTIVVAEGRSLDLRSAYLHLIDRTPG